MRSKQLIKVRKARVRTGPYASDNTYGNNGVFKFETVTGTTLSCIVSDGNGWDHVSVRAIDPDGLSRTPTWGEMCVIKDLFWAPEEAVVQYHPRKSEYVNNHPHVLHLWRPQEDPLPTPPPVLVGDKRLKPEDFLAVMEDVDGRRFIVVKDRGIVEGYLDEDPTN